MPFKAWRWDRLSLRNKLTIVNITLLTFGIVVAGIGTTLLLRPTLVSQTDSQLSVYASDPTQFLATDPSSQLFTYDSVRIAPSTLYVAVVDAEGKVVVDNWGQWQRPRAIAPEVPADAANRGSQSLFDMEDPLGASWRTITVPEGEYAADQVRGTLLIAAPLTSVNATMVNFLAIFFGFGLTVVIFGAALTRVLVSATLLPLRQVEATAMQFASGDYSQRLPAGTPNTEVGRLSRSLNTMLVRIDHAFDERTRTIAQMRRFVGDASHELRTPLVTVRGYAELYRMGALNDPEKVGQAMERIEKEALRMGGLVEDLLQLARLDETRELVKDVIDLEPIAEDAAMDAHATAKDRVVRALPVRIIQEPQDEADSSGMATTGELPAPVEAEPAADDEAGAQEATPRVARSGAAALFPAQRSAASRSGEREPSRVRSRWPRTSVTCQRWSTRTRTRCDRRSRTCLATPCGTPRRGHRSRSTSPSICRTSLRSSTSSTTARESRPRFGRRSSSASGAPILRGPARRAAQDSDCRSSPRS